MSRDIALFLDRKKKNANVRKSTRPRVSIVLRVEADSSLSFLLLGPSDSWCETALDSIEKVVDENVANGIGESETLGIKVEKRRWQEYHTI